MYFSIFALTAALASSALASPVGISERQECAATGTAVASCTATSAQNYTVASGDTLTTIGQKYSVGACDLATANKISNPNLIFVGQVLTVPAGICTADSSSCLTPNPPTTVNASCTATSAQNYTVVSGDTLTTIGQKYGVGACDLATANKISNPNLIFVGQVLTVPAGICTADSSSCLTPTPTPGNNASCTATSAQTYTVVSGDTLTTIGQKYSVGACDIATANKISNPNLITPGQVLTIPAGICKADNSSCLPPTTTPTANCTIGGPNSYLVRSGDTGTTIASNFNITLAALVSSNSAIDINVLAVNQLLNIPVCAKTKCSVETYIIKSGDLFFDLAAREGSTVGQVLASNQALDPTKLPVGQQILLPKKCRSI